MKILLNNYLESIAISQGTLLLQRDTILEIGGYNESKPKVEDWDLYLRLNGKTKFYNVQKFLVTVRKHDHNLSAPGDLFNKENMEVLVKYFQEIISKENDNKKIAKAYFDMGYIYYYENQLDKSIELFEEAVKLDPFTFQYLRYFIPNKYLPRLIEYSRKHNYYKYLNFFRKLDRNNYFFRSKY